MINNYLKKNLKILKVDEWTLLLYSPWIEEGREWICED